MMRGGNTLVYVLGLSLALSSYFAFAGSNPYHNIIERNVFGLNPPKASGPPPEPTTPPPKINLTGITTLLGNKRALMTIQLPNKPVETYMLTEGQRDGDIEVVQIDEKAGTVKVLNHGIEQLLDFANDGLKAQPAPLPGLSPTGQPAPNPTALRTIPTRTLRIPPGANALNAAGAGPGKPRVPGR